MAQDAPHLVELLGPVVESQGLALESVTTFKTGRQLTVRVTVDVADGVGDVDSDTLADVSRAVSKALDQADPIESQYLLEVSTPGAERELTLPRHWRKEIGRVVSVKLHDGSTVEGRLQEVAETGVSLDVDGTSTTIDFDNVKKARPRVEFGSISKE